MWRREWVGNTAISALSRADRPMLFAVSVGAADFGRLITSGGLIRSASCTGTTGYRVICFVLDTGMYMFPSIKTINNTLNEVT